MATAEVLARAAEQAGAPPGLVQCLDEVTLPGTAELMRHRRTSVVMATGGAAMVRAAYSSGKPTLAVGAGNVPAAALAAATAISPPALQAQDDPVVVGFIGSGATLNGDMRRMPYPCITEALEARSQARRASTKVGDGPSRAVASPECESRTWPF